MATMFVSVGMCKEAAEAYKKVWICSRHHCANFGSSLKLLECRLAREGGNKIFLHDSLILVQQHKGHNRLLCPVEPMDHGHRLGEETQR